MNDESDCDDVPQPREALRNTRLAAALGQAFRQNRVFIRPGALRISLACNTVVLAALVAMQCATDPLWAVDAGSLARIACMLPLLAAVGAAVRYTHGERYAQPLLFVIGAAWVASSLLAAYLRLGGAQGSDAIEAVIVTLTLYVLLGLPLTAALLLGAGLMSGYLGIGLLAAAAEQAAGLATQATQALWLLTANALGFAAGRRLEQAARTIFLQQQVLSLLADNDLQTGVVNRRNFDVQLHKLTRQARRESRSVALMLIEFDHFPEFQALYGRAAAQAALRRLAHAVMGSARRAWDCVARFDDAQFALLLYDTDRPGSEQLAARVRANVALLDMRHAASGTGVAVTVSIGASLQGGDAAQDVSLVETARRALSLAVAGGRNRVVMLPAVASGSPSRIVRGPWPASGDPQHDASGEHWLREPPPRP